MRGERESSVWLLAMCATASRCGDLVSGGGEGGGATEHQHPSTQPALCYRPIHNLCRAYSCIVWSWSWSCSSYTAPRGLCACVPSCGAGSCFMSGEAMPPRSWFGISRKKKRCVRFCQSSSSWACRPDGKYRASRCHRVSVEKRKREMWWERGEGRGGAGPAAHTQWGVPRHWGAPRKEKSRPLLSGSAVGCPPFTPARARRRSARPAL